MNKQLHPNLVSAGLVVLTILILVGLPFYLEISSNEAKTSDRTSFSSLNNNIDRSDANIVEFTLRTRIGGEPAMAFIGVGGEIDDITNPDLTVMQGDIVRITIINGDPMLHDLTIEAFNVHSSELIEDEQTVTVEFMANQAGDFTYYCSVPGHREIGMEGMLRVKTANHENNLNHKTTATDNSEDTQPTITPMADNAISITRNPADVPPPIGDRQPQNIRIDLTAVEVNGFLADGTTYSYMTFDRQVPGPMLRVREGDTIELHLKNESNNQLPHSIDLHAVTGPGGGAVYTQTLPSEETYFTFQALKPGLYVYHCATSSVAHHITSGMYGLILVEPEGGLPPVDHEFYVMQGEIYTNQPFGTQGHLGFSYSKMLDEDAEYFVFNGAANALIHDEYALRAEVGETVRIFFGVGGPNATSSFHVIGEIFDRVYDQASLTSSPLTDVQTTLVPPGGATMLEFTVDVPGRYILVDHALSRLERGLVGYLYVEGDSDSTIFFSNDGSDAESDH